jgi:hypothetical protein
MAGESQRQLILNDERGQQYHQRAALFERPPPHFSTAVYTLAKK